MGIFLKPACTRKQRENVRKRERRGGKISAEMKTNENVGIYFRKSTHNLELGCTETRFSRCWHVECCDLGERQPTYKPSLYVHGE
jgi:hypothetical protein